MFKLADLATLPDSHLGPLVISPSRRFVEGPEGRVQTEPLTMQVLLLLLDAGGNVVTRKQLFDQCWGGAMVGDDSLNRAILKVRRAGAATAPGMFEIETIPRTGYRLAGPILQHLPERRGAAAPAKLDRPTVSRRAAAGSAAAIAVAGGLILWQANRQEPKSPADALVDKAHDLLRYNLPGSKERAVQLLRQAVRLDAQSARAWGLLAYSFASDLDGEVASLSVDDVASADRALKNALRLNPQEPNALLARYIVEGSLHEWISADQRLRFLLKIDPVNTFAMSRLASLLQAAGLTRESLRFNERHIAHNPLSPYPHYRRALLLWIQGDVARADAAADRAMERWPDHRWVWNARFLIYAFSGRAKAALAMLNDAATRPESLSDDAVATLQVSLATLASPTPEGIARATAVNLAAAREAPGLAAYAAMTLSALGQVDAAFQIVSGFLLGQGEISTRRSSAQGGFVASRGWRRTQWLFTPPLAALRSDDRFLSVCSDIGLSQYWAHRGLRPDYLLRNGQQRGGDAAG